MITARDIEKSTMSIKKRESARHDIFAYYIGRPISYMLTVPFVGSKVRANQISYASFIPPILGFIVCAFASSKIIALAGWLCFFIWNIMDGIDGNLARYRKEFSKNGSVLDATGGYLAMVLFFFAAGILASSGHFSFFNFRLIKSTFWVVLGALSGIFQIFPRLVMHKALNETKTTESSAQLIKDKAHYGFAKIIALNLTSISGFVQPILLFSLIINAVDVFTLAYFLINGAVMLASLQSLLRE